MMRKLTLFFLLSLFLVACGGTESDPADTVEQYIQAKAAGDKNTLQNLLCSEMESRLEQESMTFAGVQGVSVQEMSCQRVGDTETVACTGQITALYGTEETAFPLTTYRVVEEDGQWKWCGESY